MKDTSAIEWAIIVAGLAILGLFVYAAIADGDHGRSRKGLSVNECIPWCGEAGVENWERSHATHYSTGKHSYVTHDTYCECTRGDGE